jgi:hypothetical protein
LGGKLTTPSGEEALYHAVFNPGGIYIEVIHKAADLWKAQEFPRHIAENACGEELAIVLFENQDIEWSEYQGTLKWGDSPDREQKYGEPPDTKDIPTVE